MSDTDLPDRFVDAAFYGWWRMYAPEPMYRSPRTEGEMIPYEEAVSRYGPIRPVGFPSPAEVEALTMALHGAGRKAVTTLLATLGRIWDKRLPDPGLGVDSEAAMRSLTAGSPGRPETLWLEDATGFGRDIYLGSPKRVDQEALETITDILVLWTDGPVYVDLAVILPNVVSGIADEYDKDGWKEVADQWLQPDSLARDDFRLVYQWLFSLSAQYDPDLVYPGR